MAIGRRMQSTATRAGKHDTTTTASGDTHDRGGEPLVEVVLVLRSEEDEQGGQSHLVSFAVLSRVTTGEAVQMARIRYPRRMDDRLRMLYDFEQSGI